LENYQTNLNLKGEARIITLQQKIKGVEIAVARYFNGIDWVGPIELNIEHKKFFPGDMGPATSEMGTLGWYIDRENNKLFNETLGKLKSHLKKINYKGAIDLNCIVNETGAYPLEVTPRFGSPIVYLQAELHKSPWGEFLKAIADGKSYDLKWEKGYGVVILVTAPPFPYAKKLPDLSPKGLNIYLDPSLKESGLKHIHFEGVGLRKGSGPKQYYISDYQGYVLYVTAVDNTVETARTKASQIIRHIYFPKMFYRHDIGISFIETEYDKLCRWGYI
jgi:phosphoribosylamine--glycine ligase